MGKFLGWFRHKTGDDLWISRLKVTPPFLNSGQTLSIIRAVYVGSLDFAIPAQANEGALDDED
jgi:hypothetical protein